MTRTPTLACAACGRPMWKSSRGRGFPQGKATCRPCRKDGHGKGLRLASGDAKPERECSQCERPVQARGLCSTHYSYWHRRQSGVWSPDWDVSPGRRLAIYERDGWTCQLCGEPVDRDADRQRDDAAPSLDHIIPRSHQLVPDHSDSNLRLAHRGCNARRGARLDVIAV